MIDVLIEVHKSIRFVSKILIKSLLLIPPKYERNVSYNVILLFNLLI